MTPPRALPPPVEIPESPSTVQVYIIDTTSFMSGFPAGAFVEPVVPGFDTMNCGSYAYLIRHPGSNTKYGTMLFDLGVRKDWENSPPDFVAGVKENGFSITVKKDVATILAENGQDINGVGAIIWSHWHFDHAGDPVTFPATTDLIVGPGFRLGAMPGYPADETSHVDARAWQGRNLHEVDFAAVGGGPSPLAKLLNIGRFRAYDFYGDGSFYLLDSPGHAAGHLSALARTTADPPSFMFLGGDIAHHNGEFRPSPYTPLPESISPDPRPGRARTSVCPGRVFLDVHPARNPNAPFFDPVTGDRWHEDAAEAKRSIEKLSEADAYDSIFPVLAHDMTLLDVVDLYPKPANAWMAKGWKEKSRWAFLGDFTLAAEVLADEPPSALPSFF